MFEILVYFKESAVKYYACIFMCKFLLLQKAAKHIEVKRIIFIMLLEAKYNYGIDRSILFPDRYNNKL